LSVNNPEKTGQRILIFGLLSRAFLLIISSSGRPPPDPFPPDFQTAWSLSSIGRSDSTSHSDSGGCMKLLSFSASTSGFVSEYESGFQLNLGGSPKERH